MVDGKIVMLGTFVGKTSLMLQWMSGIFYGAQVPTVGGTNESKVVDIRGQEVNVLVADTSGQEAFWSLTKQYVRGTDAAIIVGALSDEDSLNNLATWRECLGEACNPVPPALLLVNKVDLATDNAESRDGIVARYGNGFRQVFFVSARTGEGVEQAFMSAIQDGLDFAGLKGEMQPAEMGAEEGRGCC
jgi:small GTP-binding protein